MRWRLQEPLLIGPAERAGLQALGESLPRIWNAATTSAADRKRILRFVIREVVLDQKRTRGQVWLKIVWQTGATSDHHVQRRVHTYRDCTDIDRLRQRIVELNAEHKMKINGVDKNPMRWPDGSFSIQGAATELGVTQQTVFDYLARGWLAGRQLAKGQPWQIELSGEQNGSDRWPSRRECPPLWQPLQSGSR